MAHNLATINGQISMAYQGATPWHKLGNRMLPGADVATAMQAAGLDWTVSLHDVFLADGRKVEDVRAVIRDTDGSPILGHVGSQFHSIQNLPAFEVLDPAVREMGVSIESAGALGDGQTTWMLAKLPEGIEPVPGDTVNGYFLIVNGHDGTRAYGARPTPVRVVCQNTLTAALGGGTDMIRIRHTANAGARLDEAAKLITRMISAMKETGDTFASLAAKQIGHKQIAEYITAVFPIPEGEKVSDTIRVRRDNVCALVFSGKGAELAGATANGSTLWGAYNAVTEYFDHVRPAEAKSDSARDAANESAIFGTNWATKVRALSIARKLVAA